MSAWGRKLLSANRHAYRWSHRAHSVGRYLLRRAHEPDFAGFGLFRSRRGLFLDIGANIGQSALSFRIYQPTAPILSVEPNPVHEPDLRFVKRLIRNFDYLLCAAGDENGPAMLYVPVIHGMRLSGEASLSKPAAAQPWWIEQQYGGRRSDVITIDSVPIEVRRLDDLQLDPSFIKIDVEGTELSVLRGLSKTIERSRPVLLIERSDQVRQVRSFLRAHRYEAYEYIGGQKPFRPYEAEPIQNVFYLPKDDAEVQALLAGASIPPGRLIQRSRGDEA